MSRVTGCVEIECWSQSLNVHAVVVVLVSCGQPDEFQTIKVVLVFLFLVLWAGFLSLR